MCFGGLECFRFCEHVKQVKGLELLWSGFAIFLQQFFMLGVLSYKALHYKACFCRTDGGALRVGLLPLGSHPLFLSVLVCLNRRCVVLWWELRTSKRKKLQIHLNQTPSAREEKATAHNFRPDNRNHHFFLDFL